MTLKERLNIISTNVNLIKFLCALLVIFCHSYYIAANLTDPLYVLTNGQINIGGFVVGIFFFFSGLYTTKSLVKNNKVSIFVKRRCSKIFPELIVIVLCTIFILGLIITTLSKLDYLSNMQTYKYLLNCILIPIHSLPGVFENNIFGSTINGALWTLSVEFVCYLLIAAIWFFGKKIFKNNSKKSICIVHIVFTAALILLFVVSSILNVSLAIQAIRAMILFFMGVLFFDFSEKIKKNNWLFLFLLAVLLIAIFLPIFSYAYIVCLPYIVIYLSLFIKQLNKNYKLFGISYEMFLIGFPIQQLVTCLFGGSMDPLLNILICIPLDIILAICFSLVMKLIKKCFKSK